jgi:hypothetical protein
VAFLRRVGDGRGLVGKISQFGKLLLHACIFSALSPYGRPVDRGVDTRSGANSFKHVLCGVGASGTFRCAIASKVVEEYVGVTANVTEVDSATALGEKE